VKHSIQSLRDDLTSFRSFLSEATFLSFSAEEQESLLDQSQKLLQKLDGLGEGFLTIGLLGGTGVGKSTIMNALAGADVASTSYRRPHTDQVLIYRHAATFLPSELQKTPVPWREITHQVDAIRQILLCDLPDFDSLLGSHRDHVIRFLDHLDVLVWVVTPEKYADERFYAFLRQVQKAKQNFYFVLNKADLLFEGQTMEAGYDRLTKVTNNFQEYLTGNEISHPVVYSISAQQATDANSVAPWNQIAGFRRQIFHHRDTKEIMAIKTANLDVEVQQLVSVLEKEALNLASLRQVLGQFIEELEADRAQWAAIGTQAFEVGLEGHLKRDLFFWLGDYGSLVGPGRALAGLIRETKTMIKRESTDKSIGSLSLIEGRNGSTLQRQLERMEDRLAHRLLSRGLSAAFKNQLENVLDAESQWEDLKNRLNRSVEMWLLNAGTPSLYGFRGIQYVTYIAVFLLFIIALGGEASRHALWVNPGWSALVSMIAAIVYNLYSPFGLAALVSYVLLNLFLAFRFYSRFKKLLQRHTQKFIESLKLELTGVWQSEYNSIVEQLKRYDQELRAQMSAIEIFHEKRMTE
jgi:predicted GTPase